MKKFTKDFSCRTGERNLELLTPLADSIIKYWDSDSFDSKILDLKTLDLTPPPYRY